MAVRRRVGTAPAPPAQNIHLSFDGLAELLTGIKKTNAVPSPKKAADYSHMPKLELVEFCEYYGISAALKLKLEAICVDGPHALCWISNEALRTEGKLAIGELATLRDAEQRWKNTHW